jgi:hypothetical protein
LPQHQAVVEIFAHIQKSLQKLSKGQKDSDMPDILLAAENEPFCEAIFGFSVSEAIPTFLRDGSGKAHNDISAALRLLILAKYLNNRMAFTIVTTESERKSFSSIATHIGMTRRYMWRDDTSLVFRRNQFVGIMEVFPRPTTWVTRARY